MPRSLILALALTITSCSGGSGPSTLEDPPTEQEQFLIDNAAREGVVTTESGLQFEVLRSADGPKPNVQSTVTVHYVGELISGTEFDSSYARGAPSTFALDGTISGWAEGVQLMSVGSMYRFVLPPELAYGDRGAPPVIGPDEALVFEVELLEINS